jgi:hypothetical protein
MIAHGPPWIKAIDRLGFDGMQKEERKTYSGAI